ncbi:MAG: RNA-binding protein [Proteobacteria bacterium]|nr:RNA-binding protein [Pseudomonadota bacterium]
MKKLYVGNLPYSIGDAELQKIFEAHGEVQSVKVITDNRTGRSKGFGFVEMEDAQADAAREAVNGQEFEGRSLRVDEAQPQQKREGGGGGFGGGGGRGGYGGGGERRGGGGGGGRGGFGGGERRGGGGGGGRGGFGGGDRRGGGGDRRGGGGGGGRSFGNR